MSDEWVFYPCQMGDLAASIFFDHGIGESIDLLPLRNPTRLLIAVFAIWKTHSVRCWSCMEECMRAGLLWVDSGI
jgi:hypothetical protein